MSLRVRCVLDHEAEAAFAVLKRVSVWLEQLGRRQRIAKTTFDTYMLWQNSGVNYVVVDDLEIAGIFSLPYEPLTEWRTTLDIEEPVAWLRALATDPAHRRKGIGALAVSHALEVRSPAAIYLDCVSGFLPSYYGSLGFEVIGTQTRQYPDEDHIYDITLMKNPNR